MKHRTRAICSVAALLLALMVWSFGSSAASSNKATANNSTEAEANESRVAAQDEENEIVDADLGKFGSKIDRDEYLRLRGEYFGRLRGIEPGLPFNPELRSQAIAQMDRQQKRRRIESIVNGGLTPPIGADAAWTPLGPITLPNGSGGAVSGRATAVVVDPTNANNVYLGTAQGGVWRSVNGGASWTTIFDSAESLAIGALALAPSDPTKLYVGTGEFNACGDCFFGVGLYRIDSVDTTPTLVGPINPANTFTGRGITKILVHPTDSAIIFVATGRGVAGSGMNSLSNALPPLGARGLYRSTNATAAVGSVTFEKLTVTSDGGGTGNADTPDVVMEPGNPNNLLVGVQGIAGSNSGVYRTTNALAATPTFTQSLAIPLSTTGVGIRVQLAINKVGSIVTAYAATSEEPLPQPTGSGCSSSSLGSLHKSTDPFGAVPGWSGQMAGAAGFCQSQCFYDMPIAVDPNDANVVYVGGQSGSSSTLVCGGTVRKSTDGGNTFLTDGTGLHPDEHAFFFDGAGNIYTANDGGVWKRSASAAAGSPWTNLNNASLNTLQFEGIAVHPTDQFLMIGGTQDNGTEFQQASSGNWRVAEGGDGGYALIDQSSTDTTNVTMYHTFFNVRGNQIGFDRNNLVSCLPCIDSWEGRGAGPFATGRVPLCDGTLSTIACDGTPAAAANGITLTDNVLFYAPMALGPGSPNTVYFGSDRLYRSTDRGDHMTVVSQASISSPGVNGSPISSIAIWPGGDNIRVVGLQNGQVWATSTGSSTMVNLTSGSFPTNPNGSVTNKFVGRTAIDPNNKNVAYITFSFFAPAGQGIWKITNLVAASGAAPAAPVWSAAGNGIPSIPINAFVIDPLNSNNLYAGTDIGVYNSTDGGANWAPFGTGLPRSAVFDLKIQPTFRLLRAGTHGRGVWETPLISPGPSTVQFNMSLDSVGEAQVSKTVTITRAGDTSFPASVNYATSDTGSNNCNNINGSASSRCDYIATSGTLNFAANETSKNILIPIVDDSYSEGTESFTLTLSAAGGNNVTVGSPAMITITINDNDGATGPSPVKDGASFNNALFVREQYVDFLNREPDAGGLAFWKNQLDECENPTLPAGFTNAQNCREVRRINVSAAFFLSIEFQDTGYLVYRMYKAAYGDGTGSSTCCTTPAHNISVPVIRFNEFLPDTQRIGQGVIVGQGNWQQQLDDNKTAFAEEFVQRPRFLTDYPLTMTPAQFVDRLNQRAATAGVMPLTTAQRDQLVSDLTAGIKTRAGAFREVAENQALASAEKNRAFVLMQFFGYLRRNPNDPQDTDYTGYDFWLGKLNQFGGNFVNAEMVKSFIVSTEYVQRFGLP